MSHNQIKKLLSLVLVIAMIASLSVAAFATDDPMGQAQDCIVNMVKNVLSHENVVLKELVRVPFRAAAAVGYALGLRTAAELLNRSLQDHPEKWNQDSSSIYAQQIKNSAEYKAFNGTFGSSGNITFDIKNNPDLYLAYHGMEYTESGSTITFTDTYDFAYDDDMGLGATPLLNSIIAAVNNFAYFAQQIGAIVPYAISVTVETAS